MAESSRSTANVVRPHRLDAHEARMKIGDILFQSSTRQFLLNNHFATPIHSDEMEAALAKIHTDRGATFVMSSDLSHGALLSRLAALAA